jgi:hypothetical protein
MSDATLASPRTRRKIVILHIALTVAASILILTGHTIAYGDIHTYSEFPSQILNPGNGLGMAPY